MHRGALRERGGLTLG